MKQWPKSVAVRRVLPFSSQPAGTQVTDEPTYQPILSGDGRFVTFGSKSSQLVAGDTNFKYDVFVHDLETHQTTLASFGLGGQPANDNSAVSSVPTMSHDGRYVAFSSFATNLVEGDTNGRIDNFGVGLNCAVSDGARFVAFESSATNLVSGDTNNIEYIFVAVGPGVSEAWTIGPKSQLGGWRNDVTVSGSLAAVAEGLSVTLYDVSGAAPQKLSRLYLPVEPTLVAIAGNRLFAVSGPLWDAPRFIVADIANPQAPRVLGSCEAASPGGSMAVSGNHVFYSIQVPGVWAAGGIGVIDVSDPASPVAKGALNLGEGVIATAFTIDGTRLYAQGRQSAAMFFGYDIMSPLAPTQTGVLAVGTGESSAALQAVGNLVYSAIGNLGIRVVDVSTPASPGPRALFAVYGASAKDLWATSGGTLYVAGGGGVVVVIDAANPDAPSTLGSVAMDYALRIAGEGATVVSLSQGDEAVHKIGVSGGAPVSLGSAATPEMADGLLSDGDRLYLGGSALWIYNAADPADPILLARDERWKNLHPKAVQNGRLVGIYNSTGTGNPNSLAVIDVSDPQSPAPVGSLFVQTSIFEAAVAGTKAYLLGDYGGGFIVDIANPAAPVLAGSLPFSGTGQPNVAQQAIAAAGTVACIAGQTADGNRVHVFDVTNAQAPVLAAAITPAGSNIRLWMTGATLFISSTIGEENRLEAFDLTNPTAPRRTGTAVTPKAAQDVKVLTGEGVDPVILLAKPGGSVHTYGYSPTAGTFYTGPICPSPYSYKVTVSPTPNRSGGYTVATSDQSYGTYIQEITRKPPGCCVQTQVSPAEAAADGCTAAPVHSGTVDCGSSVPVSATAASPWNFVEWTGAATAATPAAETTASAGCAIATAHFVKPVLTLTAAASNPASTNLIYAVETAFGFRLTDESFTRMAAAGIPQAVRDKLEAIHFQEPNVHRYTSIEAFAAALAGELTPAELTAHKDAVFFHAQSNWKKDGVIAAIVLTANEVDDWTVTSVGFKASGSGDERADLDVIKVKLYKDSIGGQLLGQGTYSADDGNIAFSMTVKVPRSNSVTMVLAYDFDAEKACPCDSFAAKTHMGMIAATPDHYPNYIKLPIPEQGGIGGPSQINMGATAVVSTDPQFGEPYNPETGTYTPLPEPLKVRVSWMDHLCADPIAFGMQQRAIDQGARFADMSTARSVALNGYSEAEAVMMLGQTKGMANPYPVSADLDGAGAQCTYPVYAVNQSMTAYGLGVDLPTTAKYDGTDAGGADGFGTFLNLIQLDNDFIAADGSGNVVMVWVRDADGVFFQTLAQVSGGTNVDVTDADADIYWARWTGAAWSAPQPLTAANTASELFPRVAFGPGGKAAAVWVEKSATGERLLCRVFDAAAGTWGTAATVTQSGHTIEDPSVAVDGGGQITVLWRGYAAGVNPLYLTRADISALSWSAPQQVTHDQDVNINLSMALDGAGDPLMAWTRYNPADISAGGGSPGYVE